MERCKKCKSDCKEPGSHWHVWGETYYLCKYCSKAVEDMKPGAITDFLLPKGHELIKNPILRNIIKARINRADS